MRYSSVRDLARRYAAGKLSQESYRSQRRVLIDGITAGTQVLTYREDEPNASGRRSRMRFVATGIAAVLVIGTILFMVWKAAAGTHKNEARAQAAAIVAPPLPPSPGPELIRTFVETDDWTDVSLASFSHGWEVLAPEDQAKARASLMYPRLVSAMRQQMISEKAVAGSRGDAHLTQLQKVAKSLGIAITP